MEKPLYIKASRYARLWFVILVRDTFSPFIERTEILRFLTLPSFLLLLSFAIDTDELAAEFTRLDVSLLALAVTFPVWVALNAIIALFKVPIEENRKGQWFGNRFVYHSPLQVFTTLVSPKDDWKSFTFKVKDSEPSTFVQFQIAYDGGTATARITPSRALTGCPDVECRYWSA